MKRKLSVMILFAVLGTLVVKEAIAAADIESLEVYILKENYIQAISAGEEMLGYVSAGESARVKYLLGIAYLKTGQYQNGRNYLQEALSGAGEDKPRQEIELAVCDSYYLENNFDMADIYYNQFLINHRRSDFEYVVKFKMALTALKLGKWQEAKKLCEEVERSSTLNSQAAEEILRENQFYFTVQVGSFQNQDNAYSFCDEMKQDGYDAFIEKNEHNHLVFYRVRIGKFDTKVEVERLADNLKAKGVPVRIYP